MTSRATAARDELLPQARRLYERASQDHRAGRHRDAEAAYTAGASLLRRAVGARHPELADLLAAHAELKTELGDYHGGLALARAAYAVVEGLRGDAARRVRARSLGATGNIHRALGDYPRAGACLRRALAVARRGGETHETAIALNNLGILYKYTCEFDRAALHYRRALRITRRICGAEHPDVAGLYHNLGGLAFTQGRYRSAERWGRAALELRTRLSGTGGIAVAADAAALAASLDGLGRHAEAQQLYHRVLVFFRTHYGARHYEIAVNLNNIGASLYAEGKLAEAAGRYRAALQMKQRLLGDRHIDVALTANNLGVLYLKQHRYRLAARHIDQARAIFARRLGADHPKTAAATANQRALRDARRHRPAAAQPGWQHSTRHSSHNRSPIAQRGNP